MDIWMGIAVAGVIGFALGALVMWVMSRKQTGGTSVASLKKEHEQFREQVTDHFVETAERINRLTDSYKDLFDHLSQGAETLVDDASLRERMPQVSDQEVRLKRLGTQSRSTAASEGETPAPGDRSAGDSSGPSNDGSSAGKSEEKASEPDGNDRDREIEAPAPEESADKTGSPSSSAGSDSADKPAPAPASGAKAGSPSSSAGSDSSDKPTPTSASDAKAGSASSSAGSESSDKPTPAPNAKAGKPAD